MPRAPVIAFQPAIAAARALSGVLSLTTDAMPTSIEAPAAPAASAATQSTTTLGAKATASRATRPSADPKVIGQTIAVNNNKLTIIGVSQAGFDGVDIGYVPNIRVPVLMKAQMTPNWDDVENRRSRWVNVFGRLKPDVSREQAKAALQPYFHGILEQ